MTKPIPFFHLFGCTHDPCKCSGLPQTPTDHTDLIARLRSCKVRDSIAVMHEAAAALEASRPLTAETGDVHEALAKVIAQSFYGMETGEFPVNGEEGGPSAGDMQVAYDILNHFNVTPKAGETP